MTRDLSKAQYIAAMKRNGFEPDFLGFWKCPADKQTCIYPGNGGNRRRDRLAYAIRENERIEKKSANSR